MPAVRGTRLRAECPRRPCRTVPSSRRKSHQHRPHPHNGFLRREAALCAPAAIPPIDGSFPVYLPLQYAMPAVLFPHIPKISRNQRISHREGVFSTFRFSNYVVLTTEFGANSPNSPSRRFFPSVPVSSARSLTRVAVTQRHGCPADTLRASLTAKGCFRLFDFQLRCFNNGIRRKFAEFPLAPILPKRSRKFCPVAHPCSRDPTPRLPGGHPPRISHREGVFSTFRFSITFF